MMLSVMIVVVIVTSSWASYYSDNDYCELTCSVDGKNERHLVCERQNQCGADLKKCQNFEAIEMTDNLKQLILDEHNTYRDKVAKGQELRGSNGAQPSAANMMALKYNDELGFIAQCWANNCEPTVHSKCHRTKNLYVGQNLASRSSTNNAIYDQIETSVKLMIRDWYEEVKLFNKDDIVQYRYTNGVGHYTLLAWANIEVIGCGMAKYKSGDWYIIGMVCHYGSTIESGNTINTQMYKIGKPCSACFKNTKCNTRYSALCGQDTLDLTQKPDNVRTPRQITSTPQKTTSKTTNTPRKTTSALIKTTSAPLKTTSIPHKATSRSHKSKHTVHKTTRTPHTTTKKHGKHHKSTKKHCKTHKKHRKTTKKCGKTHSKHRKTAKKPDKTTKKPDKTTKKSDKTTSKSHKTTKKPRKTTKKPHKTTSSPHHRKFKDDE